MYFKKRRSGKEKTKKAAAEYIGGSNTSETKCKTGAYASGFLLATGLVTAPLRMQRVQALMLTT